MNWITGPNRAFGIGEQKQQNAIIKVYSAAELKNALTKIYQLPAGTGTIEIAGDITITRPIKLKRFLFGESGPREIIIQAIGGAKIINGNTDVAQGYSWNQTGNSGIPVFDYGAITTTVNPLTKYTFKDITINTETAVPFGAFIAGDLAGTTQSYNVGIISVINLKLFNVWNLFGVYDTIGTFSSLGYHTWYSTRVDNVLYRNSANTAYAITTFFLNHRNVGSYAGSYNNISTWNPGQYGQAEDDLTIVNNLRFQDNTIANVYCRTIIDLPDRANVGTGNVMMGVAEIISLNPEAGFSYINTNVPNALSSGNTTFFEANAAITNFSYGSGQLISLPSLASKTTTATGIEYAVASLTNIYDFDLPDTTTYNQYQVDQYLTVKERSTELTNSYHIRTVIKVTEGGVGSITNITTLDASEEFFTLTGLTPVWTDASKRLRTTLTNASLITSTCIYKICGLGHPNLG